MTEPLIDNLQILAPPQVMAHQTAVAKFNLRIDCVLFIGAKLMVGAEHGELRLYLPSFNREHRSVIIGFENRARIIYAAKRAFLAQGGRLPAIVDTPLATASSMESLAT
jgi:hypothetical protein